jgi:hypothetical protein
MDEPLGSLPCSFIGIDLPVGAWFLALARGVRQVRLTGGFVVDSFHVSLKWRCAMTWKTLGGGLGLVVLVIVVGVFGLQPRMQAAAEAPAQAANGARYTVIDTDASNLIVVDNKSNMLYFYTENPGEEVGKELHLRGSMDLSEVGKPTIKPKPAK